MLILPYFLLLYISLFDQTLLKKADRSWQTLLDKAQPCTAVDWLKKIRLYGGFDYLVILFFMACSWNGTKVADFYNYEQAYRIVQMGLPYAFLGKGWYGLMYLGTLLNLSYRALKMWIVGISFFLISQSIRTFVKEESSRILVWGLMLIFPAFLWIVQVRFLMASSIVILGFARLMKPSWKNAFVYILLCSIAALIHTTALFYLSFLVIWIFYRYPRLYTGISAVVLMAFMFIRPVLLYVLSHFEGVERISRYFLSGTPTGKIGLLVLSFFGMAFCVFFAICIKKSSSAKKDQKTGFLQFYKAGFALSCICLCIIPFCTFDANFYRLQRPLWIFLYTGLALYASGLPEGKPISKQPLFWFVVVLSVLANLYFMSAFTFEINLELLV